MKKRALCWLLAFVMVFSLLPVAAMAADGEPEVVSSKTDTLEDSDLHMRKSLLKNSDGTYDVTIESWSTGVAESHTITEAVPTDFVLVLDQSGSMSAADMPASYVTAGSSWKPSDIMTINFSGTSATYNTYYYKVPGTDEYYPVYYKDYPPQEMTRITSSRVKDYGTSDGTSAATYGNRAVYFRDGDGSYYRLYRDTGRFLTAGLTTFFYYDSTGNRHSIGTHFFNWLTLNPSINYEFYREYGSHGYGLYYRDAEGKEKRVEGSTVVSSTGTTFYSDVLYTRKDSVTRLEALQEAAYSFIDVVKTQAENDSVQHRVAVVGFASLGDCDNTELLSGVPLSQRAESNYSYTYKLFPDGVNYNGPEFTSGTGLGGISRQNYTNSLLDVGTDSGYSGLRTAINAVTACGGTHPEYGFYMARNILDRASRGDTVTYQKSDGTTANRNTVVVFFTDGEPGDDSTDDQIQAANDVVAAANELKTGEWKTKVFSIGIFSEGDDQPLTFTARHNDSQTERNNFIYRSGNYDYFRGNVASSSSFTDTIAHYMRAVSSTYPNAANFLNHNNTSDSGTDKDDRGVADYSVNYYMRVSDADGLKRAFELVASTIDSSSTSTTVDLNSVLKDVINQVDFDDSDAYVEAKAVKVKIEDGKVVETGEAGTSSPVVTDTVRQNHRLSVSNFDYSEKYVTTSREGEKLVVTIKNLLPAKGGHLYSNSVNAGIYATDTAGNAVIDVESPEENVARISHVIDFNAKMIFAPSVKRWKAVNSITNGVYEIAEDGSFTYQLLPDQSMPTENRGQVNLVMDGVDTVLALSTDVIWTQYTAVPANNIYFDDVLLNGDAIPVGDGSGYHEDVTTAVSEGASVVNPDGDKVLYFTFEGTGVDVYGTTAEDDGYIQVALVGGETFDKNNLVYFEDSAGTYVLNGETYEKATDDTPADATRYKSSQFSVRNYAETTRYNVPTVSYGNLPYGTYTVYLKAMKGCNYKLDGVRVYNVLGAPDTYSQEVYQQNGANQEANAKFYNLREALINDGEMVTYTDPAQASLSAQDVSKLTGVLFLDNPASVNLKIEETEDAVYSDAFEAYKANGPKNEIYLENGQAIALQLSDEAKGDHYWLGLSAPETGKNTGTVTVNNEEIPVAAAVDMFYPITVGEDGIITVENTGDNLISVTKLKVTSDYNVDADKASIGEEPNAAQPFALLPMKAVRMAANHGIDPEAPVVTAPDAPAVTEPDQPHQNDPFQTLKNLVQQIVSNFVRTLFQNISRLFGK